MTRNASFGPQAILRPVTTDRAVPRGDEQTDEWRREQLRRLGYIEPVIDVCIARGVDYHDLERAISNGCDPVLALDIYGAGRAE